MSFDVVDGPRSSEAHQVALKVVRMPEGRPNLVLLREVSFMRYNRMVLSSNEYG